VIRRFLVRVLLSVVAIACVAVSVWEIVDDPFNGTVPFRMEQQGLELVLRARADVPSGR
jgi:hypothetical protein